MSQIKEIPLTHGHVALVDEEDYQSLCVHKWHAKIDKKSGRIYAARGIKHGNGRVECVRMHRVILRAKQGQIVDHVSRDDTLDNRRSNLRIATKGQNKMNEKRRRDNKTGFKGVGIDRRNGLFRARLSCQGKRYCGGFFAKADDAARAYDDLARRHHGEFAHLNFSGNDA